MAWKAPVRAAVSVGFAALLLLVGTADEAPKFNLSGPLDNLQLLAQPQPGGASASYSLGVAKLSVPEWLKRVDIGIQHGTEKPRYHIETVQPLYQTFSVQ